MTSKLTVAGIIGAVLIGGCYLIVPFDPCGNEISREFLSPDRSRKAVIFSRDCGATTSFNTQVSLLWGAKASPQGKGNVFIADDIPIDVKWLSNTQLNIAYPKGTENFYKIYQLDGVSVTYQYSN